MILAASNSTWTPEEHAQILVTLKPLEWYYETQMSLKGHSAILSDRTAIMSFQFETQRKFFDQITMSASLYFSALRIQLLCNLFSTVFRSNRPHSLPVQLTMAKRSASLISQQAHPLKRTKDSPRPYFAERERKAAPPGDPSENSSYTSHAASSDTFTTLDREKRHPKQNTVLKQLASIVSRNEELYHDMSNETNSFAETAQEKAPALCELEKM